jgi:hypothetical protein
VRVVNASTVGHTLFIFSIQDSAHHKVVSVEYEHSNRKNRRLSERSPNIKLQS